MNGKQRAVIWLGLILITFNLVRKWPEISGIIFSGAGTTTPPASGGGGGSGGGSVQVPIDPFLPIGPKITIPIPKL